MYCIKKGFHALEGFANQLCVCVSLVCLFCATVIDSGVPENGEWAPACSSSFGGWEAHTRGIGSKLLVQMGYEFGKGKERRFSWWCESLPASQSQSCDGS